MAATATHDHHHAESNGAIPQTPVDTAIVKKLSLMAAVVGWLVFFVCGIINSSSAQDHQSRDWFLAYLCGFIFWTSLPFGSLALSMIAYLTSASWGVIFRRIMHASVRTLPVLFVLGLPVMVSFVYKSGADSPYWWADSGYWDRPDQTIAEDDHRKISDVREFNHKRHDWLSTSITAAGGFPLRYVIYFAIIGTFAFFVLKWSRQLEDIDSVEAKRNLRGISGPGVLVWALTMAIFTTDWVMSLEPTWASSMFPVVFGMNQFLTTLAFSAFLFYTLTDGKAEVLAIIKDKFRIDVGSLILGFTMIWSYASFCQFMLIWAGNLPEEIGYYINRGAGPAHTDWIYLTYFLMLCHWLIPFIVLLFREVKTNPKSMRIMTVFLLTCCAADVIWWIMPSVSHDGVKAHVPMAFGAILGVGGLWGLAFARELGKRPLLVNNSEGKFIANWGHHH